YMTNTVKVGTRVKVSDEDIRTVFRIDTTRDGAVMEAICDPRGKFCFNSVITTPVGCDVYFGNKYGIDVYGEVLED
ncbi:unnamed protein product, partial [marine sediment metagenome]